MMIIVHVFFDVKTEYIESFKKASQENAENSLKEPGVLYFDILQDQENLSKFVFMEAYQTPADQLKHKETFHYKKWREKVSDMLTRPYGVIKYNQVFPRFS